MLNKDKSNQNEKTRNRTRYLLKEKSMKNILKVRMLGGFTLEYKGKELVLDRNNVSKTTQLFQLLLLHTQDGGISKAALIDALYGRSDVENKNGSLNNTIFRLRKQLTAAGLPESSYININGGMCTWDPDIETSVDVCDFKQTIESARHEKSQKTKMEIYAKAWKLYTGEFLPDMMGEDWAAVENIACRDMYFDCVEELCHYLKTEEKFEELYRVAHSAAEIYPFYDWQIWEIDSLIGMSRYKDGLDVYKRTTKLMFEELGLSPSAGMLERFKLMGERTSQAAGAIEDIKYRLREKESIEGAYYCTYPSFVDYCRMLLRARERHDLKPVLMFLTLGQQGKRRPERNSNTGKSTFLVAKGKRTDCSPASGRASALSRSKRSAGGGSQGSRYRRRIFCQQKSGGRRMAALRACPHDGCPPHAG